MDTDLDHVGGCMANHSKFIKLLLSFVIAISPIILINNANAASLGGWTLGGGVAEGASTVYNGTKNVLINGKNVVQKGVATVTPTATQVSKVLARGAAGYALSIAVEQLLGAVDWVLDPVNNQIKYKPKADPQTCSGFKDMSTNVIYCSAQSLVDSHTKKNNWESSYVESIVYRGQFADIYHCFKPNSSYTQCITSMITTQVITGTDETEEQKIPLPLDAKSYFKC